MTLLPKLLPTTRIEAVAGTHRVVVTVSDRDDDRIAQYEEWIDGAHHNEEHSVKARLAIVELKKMLPLLQRGFTRLKDAPGHTGTADVTLIGTTPAGSFTLPAFTIALNTAPLRLLDQLKAQLQALVAKSA